jgi:fumarate reductase subunit D
MIPSVWGILGLGGMIVAAFLVFPVLAVVLTVAVRIWNRAIKRLERWAS